MRILVINQFRLALAHSFRRHLHMLPESLAMGGQG